MYAPSSSVGVGGLRGGFPSSSRDPLREGGETERIFLPALVYLPPAAPLLYGGAQNLTWARLSLPPPFSCWSLCSRRLFTVFVFFFALPRDLPCTPPDSTYDLGEPNINS